MSAPVPAVRPYHSPCGTSHIPACPAKQRVAVCHIARRRGFFLHAANVRHHFPDFFRGHSHALTRRAICRHRCSRHSVINRAIDFLSLLPCFLCARVKSGPLLAAACAQSMAKRAINSKLRFAQAFAAFASPANGFLSSCRNQYAGTNNADRPTSLAARRTHHPHRLSCDHGKLARTDSAADTVTIHPPSQLDSVPRIIAQPQSTVWVTRSIQPTFFAGINSPTSNSTRHVPNSVIALRYRPLCTLG